MILIKDRFLCLDAVQVWWPESPEQVYPLLSTAAVVTVMQCADDVAESLKALAFRWKPFHTLLLDLARPEDALWRGIQSRTRSYINHALKLNCRILVNRETDKGLRLINEFIRRKKYRPPVSSAEWSRLVAHGDVFLATYDDRVIAAEVTLVDHPLKARLILGATADREDMGVRPLIGPLGKRLVWFMCNYYKAKGVRWYDFGGVALNQASPLHSISQFKLAFGGHPVTEYTLRLSGHPLLRLALRGLVEARLRWRATIPGH